MSRFCRDEQDVIDLGDPIWASDDQPAGRQCHATVWDHSVSALVEQTFRPHAVNRRGSSHQR